MPLQDIKSSQSYIKVSKVFVSSAARAEGSVSAYDYFIDLPQEIQYVVAMEVTGYNFPTEIAPTFIAGTNVTPGTNMVDFELTTGVITTQFTAIWPEKQYTYENVTVPYLSYVATLQQIMNQAIEADPDFGGGGAHAATFVSETTPDENTKVAVSGAGVTGFRFLFDSGPNRRDAAFLPMGFNQTDTALALSLTSPGQTILRPYRFVDINVDAAAELTPLKRVYMTDTLAYGTVRNDPDLTRTRLLSSQPVRLLRRLRVKLTLLNGVVPPSHNGLDHEFTLTVLNIANEVEVPSWMRQSFVL